MSLVQAALESSGIVTASITVLPDLTRRLAPPRALVVDAGLGAPFGEAGNPEVQRRVLLQLLSLLTRIDVPVLG